MAETDALFSWENIIGEATTHHHDDDDNKHKQTTLLTGSLKRRLEKINDKAKQQQEHTTSDVTVKHKLRRVALKHAQSSISKFAPAALRPELTSTVVYGKSDPENSQSAPLTSTAEGVVSEVDAKIKRLIDRAMSTSYGDKLRTRMQNFPISGSMTEARTLSLKRQAKAAVMREIQNMKRLKKIKSKAFRKHHRKDDEKDALALLTRLQEVDPDAAENLREDYEKKRAEMRIMRQSQARRKWAKAAARFGGREAQKLINQQLSNESERRNLFKSLSAKGIQTQGDSDNDDSTTSEGEDDNNIDNNDIDEDDSIRYMKQVNDVLESNANSNSSPTSGIANMKFMKMGREKRQKEIQEEAESFFKYLSEGLTPKQAALASSQDKSDDFLLKANHIKDPETTQREHLLRKRANSAATTTTDKSTKKQTAVFKAEDFHLDQDMTVPGITKQHKKRSTRKPDQTSPVVMVEPSPAMVVEPQPSAATLMEQNLLVKMAFNITDEDAAEEEFDEALQAEARNDEAKRQRQLKQKNLMLGWGSWTVPGMREDAEATINREVESIVTTPNNRCRRLRVKWADNYLEVPAKYKPVALSDGVDTACQHDMLMQTAVGPEWLGDVSHSEMIRPEYKTVGGRVIEAMKFDNDVKRMLVESQLKNR